MQFMFQPATPDSVAAFLAICIFVVAAFWRGIWLSARVEGHNPVPRTFAVALLTALWLGLAAAIVHSGWLANAPARLPIFMGVMLIGSLLAGITRIGRWLSIGSPVEWLLAFQGFRLPLELVLHTWVRQGVIPSTMTWTGSNWDVIAGISALLLAPLLKHAAPRTRNALALTGNLIGWSLLINVMRVALLSAPVPFGWPEVTPKLLLPFHLPYALIVPVCVGGALIGQIALTRALVRSGATKETESESRSSSK